MLPTWTTDRDIEQPEYLDFQERLENIDNNNWEKSDYMTLIKDILHDNWTSALDIATIENAIYSYAESR